MRRGAQIASVVVVFALLGLLVYKVVHNPKGLAEAATSRAGLSCEMAGAISVPSIAIAVSEVAIFMGVPFSMVPKRAEHDPSREGQLDVRQSLPIRLPFRTSLSVSAA